MIQNSRAPEMTYLKLRVESNFQKFFKGYTKLLQKKFKQIEVHGNNYRYSYYTCGQIHDPRNPEWKPFQHLWNYCEKTQFDFFEVRDMIFERIGYKVVCECQLLGDYKERRRMELTNVFGVDFGEPGNRCVDII
jgi:hypothetical protein